MESKSSLAKKYESLKPHLNEQTLRLSLAAEAVSYGHGGILMVSRETGVSRATIRKGIKELNGETATPSKGNVRRAGGGRKRTIEKDENLLKDLDELLDPVTRGDPMSPLRWSSKSTSKLAAELKALGHEISKMGVWRLLSELGYSMQSNRKTKEGQANPDRNAQFEYINETVKRFLQNETPVISVDCKKKENLGEYRNVGREWEKKGQPQEVKVHDFPDKKQGKAIPYGVYEVKRNEGWVNVGVTKETAQFAVNSIEAWWNHMGRKAYPQATELLITADGGGSNGSRVKLWKIELHKLAKKLGMTIHVRHFPPGKEQME